MKTVCLVFAVFPVVAVIYCWGELIQQPKDETVFLGNTSHFACGTRGSSIRWRVNGSEVLPASVTVTNRAIPGFDFLYSTLEIPGAAEYNGTKVQCFSGDGDDSNIATMFVQGTLSAVVNVTVLISDDSIMVFWAAPFSLDVSHVEHDILYSIFFYNVTGRRQIDCADCVNISKTDYSFTPDYLGQCEEFTITITPVNGAGEGQKHVSSVINGNNTSCNVSKDEGPKSDDATPGNDDETSSPVIIPAVTGVCAGIVVLLVVSGGLLVYFKWNEIRCLFRGKSEGSPVVSYTAQQEEGHKTVKVVCVANSGEQFPRNGNSRDFVAGGDSPLAVATASTASSVSPHGGSDGVKDNGKVVAHDEDSKETSERVTYVPSRTQRTTKTARDIDGATEDEEAKEGMQQVLQTSPSS